MAYRNFSSAFVNQLSDLKYNGQRINVRGTETLEITGKLIEIAHPEERIICLPGRKNNIFATVAETLWVLAGRNDIEYLSHYLPRAKDFSDDGITWRAGYGKRLRDFHGVDQIAEIIRILNENINSRQAVAVIFDPTEDFQKSKDIPCTNWLHFMVREGELNMSVAIRSNDIIWGASGINWFEWSVLQEHIAHSVGVSVGKLSYFADSLHIYSTHYDMADTIISNYSNFTDMYACGMFSPVFSTPAGKLDEKLAFITIYESLMRTGEYEYDKKYSLGDPFLDICILTLAIANSVKHDNVDDTVYLVNSMQRCDLRLAILENLCRKQELDDRIMLSEIEMKFLRQFENTNFVKTLS